MNFPLILLLLTIFTGVFWVLEKKRFAPERRARAEAAAGAFEAANREAVDRGEPAVIEEARRIRERELRQPWWIEYTADIFPVILAVFLVRSFLFEPFRIPSGSMLPTLHVGDFILVNKYDYGIRLPVLDKKIIPVGHPERGDVVVFRYPMDTSVDYIKRVVGVPGDVVDYHDKVLRINGVEQLQTGKTTFVDPESLMSLDQYDEDLSGVRHMIAVDPNRPPYVPQFALKKDIPECKYDEHGFTCRVPKGQYFVMGDNRDNSEDSRYWGFVPDENLVGRATLIWANFGNMRRIGTFN